MFLDFGPVNVSQNMSGKSCFREAGTLFAHRPGTFTQPNLSNSSGITRAGDFPAMFLEFGSGDVSQNMSGKSRFRHAIRV